MNTYFKIGSNMRERNTQIERDGEVCAQRIDFLYSYDTPVAYFDRVTQCLYVTGEYHSATTSRHISKWVKRFGGFTPMFIDQKLIWDKHHEANLWEAHQAGVA